MGAMLIVSVSILFAAPPERPRRHRESAAHSRRHDLVGAPLVGLSWVPIASMNAGAHRQPRDDRRLGLGQLVEARAPRVGRHRRGQLEERVAMAILGCREPAIGYASS